MTNLQGASKSLPSVQRERLSEGEAIYCVYWVHLEHHTTEEGYIGITKDFKERIRAHKKNRKRTKFTSAIKHYNDSLIWEVIHDNLTLEKALELEAYYRPAINKGWNLQKGGELGVESSWYEDSKNRDKHRKATSAATKVAIAEKDSTEKRSARAKKSWEHTREKRVLAVTGERNPKAKLSEKQVRAIKYELIPAGFSNLEIAEMYNVKSYVISFIRTGKNWKHV